MDQSPTQSMLGAVMYADTAEVRRLAEQHVGLEERYPPDQSTPMVWAAAVDQWPLVEFCSIMALSSGPITSSGLRLRSGPSQVGSLPAQLKITHGSA